MSEKHLVYVFMGVSGTGKSTIGQSFAEELNIPFLDADDDHSEANKKKMGPDGPGLEDSDRWPWLEKVSARVSEALKKQDVVLACSVLKRSYRDFLFEKIDGDIQLVFLYASQDVLEARLGDRTDHFFNPELLIDQLATLEIPTPDEGALRVDVGPSPEEIVASIVKALDGAGEEKVEFFPDSSPLPPPPPSPRTPPPPAA